MEDTGASLCRTSHSSSHRLKEPEVPAGVQRKRVEEAPAKSNGPTGLRERKRAGRGGAGAGAVGRAGAAGSAGAGLGRAGGSGHVALLEGLINYLRTCGSGPRGVRFSTDRTRGQEVNMHKCACTNVGINKTTRGCLLTGPCVKSRR